MNRQVTDPQPILFFAWLGLGMLSLLVSILWLLVTPGILGALSVMSPDVIAWAHLMILGWLCSLFFAAGYQLTPVVALNPLSSKWLSRIHFFLHISGVPTMVISFAHSNYPALATGGSLVVVGFVIFAINVISSFSFDAKWNHLNIAWTMGIFWLLVGAAMALVAVAVRLNLIGGEHFNRIVGIHIHTMIGGFFLMILIAAASKLVPMFMLSPEKNQWGTWIAAVILNLALVASYWGLHSSEEGFRAILMLLVLISLIAYYWQLFYFAKHKRRKWDAGMALFYLANALILPAWWMFFRYHQNGSDVESFRGGVFVMTFLVFNGCILGMAQKIVPFMLWHHLYSKHLGKMKVPQTIDLLNQWTLWPIAITYLVSSSLFVAAWAADLEFFIQPAVLCMLMAFVFTASNASKFVSHWRNPILTPFPKR